MENKAKAKKELSRYGTVEVFKEDRVLTLFMTGNNMDHWESIADIKNILITYYGEKYPKIEVMKNGAEWLLISLKSDQTSKLEEEFSQYRGSATTSLNNIYYQHVMDLTLFFLGRYKDREIKYLDTLVSNVKKCRFVHDFTYTFDESIRSSSYKEEYNDLIEFRVQLVNSFTILPFRLRISRGSNQEPQLFNSNGFWL